MKFGLNRRALRLGKKNLITNIYGIARTLMAAGTLITFLFNPTCILFSNVSYNYEFFERPTFSNLSLFYIFPNHLELLRWLSVIILIVIISGWRPRVTGILHWYITYSFYISCDFVDGGDQIASILTLFLIPFCLFDNRKWIWLPDTKDSGTLTYMLKNILLNAIYFLIRLQVCIIYFHASVAKMKVPEWINGTATYYWFTNNTFGVATWMKPFVIFLFSKSLIVIIFSWGTMIFEAILSMSIMMTRTYWNWRILLIAGLVFHLGILFIHGLVSFFFSMSAALILYLYPLNLKFNFFNLKG